LPLSTALDHGPRPVPAAGLVLVAIGRTWLRSRLDGPAAKARVSADFRSRKAPLGACGPAPKSV